MRKMYEVVKQINGAHPLHTSYPLLPGDLLRKDSNGTWTKECPGLTVSGFVLTEHQQKRLKEVNVESNGLRYFKAP